MRRRRWPNKRSTRGLEGTLEDGLDLEQRLFVASFGMGDATVGVRSFLTEGPGKAVFD